MSKKYSRKDQDRVAGIHRQVELYEGQRAKHQAIISGAPGRRAYLEEQIQARLEAIATMRQELEDMPAQVTHSRSVISRLNDDISTLKATHERIKTKYRKLAQIARINDKIAKLEKGDN